MEYLKMVKNSLDNCSQFVGIYSCNVVILHPKFMQFKINQTKQGDWLLNSNTFCAAWSYVYLLNNKPCWIQWGLLHNKHT